MRPCGPALLAVLVCAIVHPRNVWAICDDFDLEKLDSTKEEDYCKFKISSGKPPKKGEVCMAHPEDLSPTQAAFGEATAACKQQELHELATSKGGKLKSYLMDHVAPAVLGPSGYVYITDHHHLAHALLQTFLPYSTPKPHRAMFVCITEDFSDLALGAFWDKMKKEELVLLQDERGENITVDELPSSVKYLRDDPYRTLSEDARDSFAFVKCGTHSIDKRFPQCSGGVVARPFIEFRWANWYRTQFPAENIYIESDQEQINAFKRVFADVLKYSLSNATRGLEGWNLQHHAEAVTFDERGCTKAAAAAAAASMFLV